MRALSPRFLAAALVALVALVASPACRRRGEHPRRITLSLSGAHGRPVHGVDLTVALPAGASVPHEPSTGRVMAAAIALRAGAPEATVDAHFSRHERTPSLRLLLASRRPMEDGELVRIDVAVASVAPPARERFEVVRAAVAGLDGASIAGATGWVSDVAPLPPSPGPR